MHQTKEGHAKLALRDHQANVQCFDGHIKRQQMKMLQSGNQL